MRKVTKTLLAIAMLAGGIVAQASTAPKPEPTLAEKVRRELVMLPYYSVFDDLRYRIDGDTVVLSGAVTRPMLRSSAENVVRAIRGVELVRNEVRVLPLSPFDDRIRLATARAVFSGNALFRYSLAAVPSVRIIVENGNITLTGVVANEFDRTLAYMRAMSVPGAFSVKNDLLIEQRS